MFNISRYTKKTISGLSERRIVTSLIHSSCNNAKKMQDIGKLVDMMDAFIFDCDGVIWKGNTVISQARETIHHLRGKLGKKIFFVTNNATLSRRGNKEKFLKLGFDVKDEEVLCSSYAVALYLNKIRFQDSKKKVIID